MIHVDTLQSDSKIHVQRLQRFDEFFKKNCQICIVVVFNNVNTVRSEMWVLFFHITHTKNSSNHSSSTCDLTRFFGICDVEKSILTFPPHSILSIFDFFVKMKLVSTVVHTHINFTTLILVGGSIKLDFFSPLFYIPLDSKMKTANMMIYKKVFKKTLDRSYSYNSKNDLDFYGKICTFFSLRYLIFYLIF